jgi:hypothetical protein
LYVKLELSPADFIFSGKIMVFFFAFKILKFSCPFDLFLKHSLNFLAMGYEQCLFSVLQSFSATQI